MTITDFMVQFATPTMFLALIAFVWNFSSRITRIESNDTAIEKGMITLERSMTDRCTALNDKVEKISSDVTWFVRSLAKDATGLQHQPHPEAWRLDGLIEKLHDTWAREEQLPPEEVNLMRALLWEKYKDESVNRSEREGAYLALRTIEFLYPEHRGNNPIDLATWDDGTSGDSH